MKVRKKCIFLVVFSFLSTTLVAEEFPRGLQFRVWGEVATKILEKWEKSYQKLAKEKVKEALKRSEEKTGRVQVKLVETKGLEDGVLAQLVPKRKGEKIMVEVQIDGQIYKHPAIVDELRVYLGEIVLEDSNFNKSLLWVEKAWNAIVGSPIAEASLWDDRMTAHEKSNFSELYENIGEEYTPFSEQVPVADSRKEELRKDKIKAAKAASLDRKKRISLWEKQKKNLDKLDQADKRLDDLIMNNDRKGVRKMLEAYLPWPLMEPIEKRLWLEWMNGITNPGKKVVLFRGLDDNFVREGEKGFMTLSPLLHHNQGTYNRRLRSLTTFREKAMSENVTYPSLLRAMEVHATNPMGTPFMSLSNLESAESFGNDKLGAFSIGVNRFFPNIMADSYDGEYERLAILFNFPGESIAFVKDVPGRYDVDIVGEVREKTEKKLKRRLKPIELEDRKSENIIDQGLRRFLEILNSPSKGGKSGCYKPLAKVVNGH